MPNDPFFNKPAISEKLLKDPQVMAMVRRGQTIRFAMGGILLVVLGVILLMTVLR